MIIKNLKIILTKIALISLFIPTMVIAKNNNLVKYKIEGKVITCINMPSRLSCNWSKYNKVNNKISNEQYKSVKLVTYMINDKPIECINIPARLSCNWDKYNSESVK